ncbi:MAG TPA: SpoIID/LytB domain-containing protein [Gaiellaceae bacterium]|nr:SpoIID/LytB domain-containing protein [Gaiellaceae bacterium]
MVRRRLLLILAAGAALAAAGVCVLASGGSGVAAQTPKPGALTFVVSGRGWGHGVGLSQWGAYGFAREGATFDEILGHYYQGTTLGPAPVSRVRVLLAQGRGRLTVSSLESFRVRDGAGATHDLAAGAHTFGPGLRLKVDNALQARPLPGPLLFLPGAAPLRLDRPYRGQLLVSVASGRLRAVNNVGLEGYLYGVVPSEVPFHWPAEVLKAQGVAARTYALAVRKTGSYFDLYPDVRSQVYRGIAGERPSTTAAVQATAGQVVLYNGQIAKTYFFSTSGGRTATVTDVWPSNQPVPYLVSVDDPYDSASPHHQWGPFTVKASRLVRALRVPGRLLDVRVSINGSARVKNVTAVGSGGEVTATGADVRRALGLRSTWFRIGLLSLTPPAAPATYNSLAELTGIARGVGAVSLEQRARGGSWRTVGPVTPARDGTVTVSTRPRETAEYRLASGKAKSGVVALPVAPLVRFYGMVDASSLRGYARPVLPGASVALQRLDGTVWRAVTRATIDANGDFLARLALAPGSYRARLAPGRGFVPGLSPVFRVGPA